MAPGAATQNGEAAYSRLRYWISAISGMTVFIFGYGKIFAIIACMKPSNLQYILAYGPEISAVAGVVMAWVFGFQTSGGMPVMDASYIAGVLVLVVLVIPGGAVLGLMFLAPLLRMVSNSLNGAPFKAGDEVRILRGPHRDKITRVYETWDVRKELRVDLGEELKQSVKDVFNVEEVCRVKN